MAEQKSEVLKNQTHRPNFLEVDGVEDCWQLEHPGLEVTPNQRHGRFC